MIHLAETGIYLVLWQIFSSGLGSKEWEQARMTGHSRSALCIAHGEQRYLHLHPVQNGENILPAITGGRWSRGLVISYCPQAQSSWPGRSTAGIKAPPQALIIPAPQQAAQCTKHRQTEATALSCTLTLVRYGPVWSLAYPLSSWLRMPLCATSKKVGQQQTNKQIKKPHNSLIL